MNQKQRKEWEVLVKQSSFFTNSDIKETKDDVIIAANAYILKLERELQNIKGHKRIARVLMPKAVLE